MSEERPNKYDAYSPIEHLYHNIKRTAQIRFYAARRLDAHQRWLVWSTSLYSVGSIMISVLGCYGEKYINNSTLSSIVQILLNLLILVFALILGSSSYGWRSEKMRQCGVNLLNLSYSILPFIKLPHNQGIYKNCIEKFGEILNGCENHKDVDFERMKFNHPGEISFWGKICFRFKFASDFVAYIMLLGIFTGAFVLLILIK